MFDIQYFVNEKKGVVVCKISDTAETVVKDMVQHDYGPANEDTYLYSLLNDSYVGKARCSANDTFDEDLGRKIAYKRALAKLNHAKEKMVKRIAAHEKASHERFMDIIGKLEERYARIAANVEKDCKELIGENDADNTTHKPHITEGDA